MFIKVYVCYVATNSKSYYGFVLYIFALSLILRATKFIDHLVLLLIVILCWLSCF